MISGLLDENFVISSLAKTIKLFETLHLVVRQWFFVLKLCVRYDTLIELSRVDETGEN